MLGSRRCPLPLFSYYGALSGMFLYLKVKSLLNHGLTTRLMALEINVCRMASWCFAGYKKSLTA